MAFRYSSRPGTGRGGGRYVPRRRVCSFCVDKVTKIDYKDSAKLSRYISDRGRIEPRRKTGTCARHQRALAMAIKRARHIALLPFVAEHIRKAGNVAVLKPGPIAPKPAPAESAASSETPAPAEPAASSETPAPVEPTASSGTEEAAAAS